MFGKLHKKLLLTCATLIAPVSSFIPVFCFAQQNPTHWEFSAQGTIHAPIFSSLDIGSERLKFLPCAGLNLRIGYKISESKKTECFAFISRGSTPFWYNIKIYTKDYPQLRDECVITFYQTHPYFTIGAYLNYYWKENKQLSVFAGNRFYKSASTKTSIVSYDVNTLQQLLVFEAQTGTNSRYFCPEVSLAYSAPIVKKFPSWNYELLISIAPVRVIQGGYTFFPDYPDGSLGYFKLQQSYVGIGIKYRRVKKEE